MTLFTNARIVTPDDVFLGSVVVEDGLIAAVEPGRSAARGVMSSPIDLDGDYLVPGVVELHTDVLERHAIPRPGVHWPELPAVLAYDSQLVGAGITTVLDSLAIGYLVDTGQRPRDPRPLVEAIRTARAAGLLRADHHLHMRCEVSTALVVQDFLPFADDPLVRLVSLMDHAPGQRQFVDVAKYREYNQGRYGLTDAQLDALVERRLEERARYAEEHRAAITALCRKHGLPVASHDDATVAHVDEAMQAGAAIAEFPDHPRGRGRRARLRARGAGRGAEPGARPVALRQCPRRAAGRAGMARRALLRLRARERAPRRVPAARPSRDDATPRDRHRVGHPGPARGPGGSRRDRDRPARGPGPGAGGG